MIKYRKNMAKLFFFVFLIFLVFSSVFGVIFLGHECIGDSCDICYEINFVRNIFDGLLILSLIFIFMACSKDYINEIFFFRKNYMRLTPVTLKIRLLE